MPNRKARYASGRQKNIKRGLPLNPNASIAARYELRMKSLIRRMCEETESEIKELFRSEPALEYFAMDDTVSSQAKILMNKLVFKFDKLFSSKAKPFAEAMVDENEDASAEALRASFAQLVEGVTIKTDILTGELKEAITASIAENVALIKSIPTKYLDSVQGAVYRSITSGNGMADLIPFLQKHKGITLRRARIIANDQSRKVFSNINRIRAQKLGVQEYIWLHSSASLEPRKTHKAYNGKKFRFDDPPPGDKPGERAGPGILIGCKCRALPIISFSEE